MSNIVFSIIIPSKNTFKLLQNCLASIPQRNDVEVIVVDDNSDPSVIDFEHYPGLNRPNTEVILTKEGKGAGFARNVGLQKARGNWVLFSDSDDTFETENLSRMLDRYSNSSADIVFFNANRVDELTGEIKSRHLSKEKYEHDPVRYAYFMRYCSNVPWAKMIKRELIDNNTIRFSEVPSANDLFFSVVSGFYAKEVIIDFTVIYNWKVRMSGSITSTVSSISILSKLGQASKRNEFLYEKGEISWCANLYTSFYWRLRDVDFSHNDALKEINKHITIGPKFRWWIEFCFMWPLDAIRNKCAKSRQKGISR